MEAYLFSTGSQMWIFFLTALLISAVILVLSFSFNIGKSSGDKVSAYECGFNAFDDARGVFDIKFYIVAILFLVFDLEALFFFPWSINLDTICADGYLAMLDFFAELLVGYVYVWRVGALNW